MLAAWNQRSAVVVELEPGLGVVQGDGDRFRAGFLFDLLDLRVQRALARGHSVTPWCVILGIAGQEYATRGSALAYARSVSRFTRTNTTLRNSTDPESPADRAA